MDLKVRAATGVMVVVAVTGLVAGCTSSSGKSSKPSGGKSGASHSASKSYTPPKPATGVSITEAKVTVSGKNGTMAGRIRNSSGTAYRVTAIACACASDVRSGKPGSGGKLTSIVGGSPLPAHASLRFGTSSLQVKLTGVFASATSGAKVPVIIYVNGGASIRGTATVG